MMVFVHRPLASRGMGRGEVGFLQHTRPENTVHLGRQARTRKINDTILRCQRPLPMYDEVADFAERGENDGKTLKNNNFQYKISEKW